jgi:hypothetical protein
LYSVLDRFDSALGGGALRLGEVLFKKSISMFNPVEIDDCPDFIATKYVPLSDICCITGEINFTSCPPCTVEFVEG